jgi:hypothetical protein
MLCLSQLQEEEFENTKQRSTKHTYKTEDRVAWIKNRG